MKDRSTVRHRLLQDRALLRNALRDHDAGKTAHLSEFEKRQFVASIRQRIAELDAKINQSPDA